MKNIKSNINGFFNKNFLKQPMMINTFFALLPLLIVGIYFYGIRILVLFFITTFFAIISEYLFAKLLRQKVSIAVFVSSILYVLSLPPNIPFWISVVGIIFGIVFGKMFFGGFGKNVFNPAITGRAFIYVAFGPYLTSGWVNPLIKFPAGFLKYRVDSISSATPLKEMISKGKDLAFNIDYIKNLLFGNKAGCIGEGFIILVFIIGLYLIYKKYASYQVVLSGFISFVFFSSIFYILGKSANPIFMIITGGWLFGLFFMITDPVTSSTTKLGKIIYGALYGFFTVIIRIFGIWTEGAMFAILLSNTFIPAIDYFIKKK